MKNDWKTGAGIAVAAMLALLAPREAYANPGTTPVQPCSGHGSLTITISWNANPPQGQHHVSVSPDPNTTCVYPGDTISFTLDSSVPPNATWSASFPAPTPGGIFVNNCTFGNGTNQSSSCQVTSTAPVYTYEYSVTVTAANTTDTLDPKVIIQSTRKRGKHHHKKPKKTSSTTQ